MKAETQSIRDDLAFRRAPVRDDGRSQKIADFLFLAGGLAYGRVCGLGRLAWMAAPGLVMMRRGGRAA